MKLTKEKLERAFTELSGSEVFPHHVRASLMDARKPDEDFIEGGLQGFLIKSQA
jgi:hypothetical protein